VAEGAAAKAKAKATLSAGGGSFRAIHEECRSLVEQIEHFKSNVQRVPNTMEFSDYFEWAGKQAVSEPCYTVESALSLDDVGTSDGLCPLLDELLLVNPDFALVTQLSELGEVDFLQRDYQRPAGYAATTRLHAGRLCVPVLNDTGATCSCITEEQWCI
jgi:hypothetical protein